MILFRRLNDNILNNSFIFLLTIYIMQKIAFVFDSMFYGGIQRVGIDYIRLLKSRGYDVDIYILNPRKTDGIVNELPDDCKVKNISLPLIFCPEAYWRAAKQYWWGKYAFPIIFLLLRVFLFGYKWAVSPRKRYDIAIAFSGHLNDLTFVAYDFLKTKKKCCWLHGGLYSYIVIVPGFERLYMKIKNLVVLTDLCQKEVLFFNKFLHLNISKIYNPSLIKQRTVDEMKVSELKKKYGDFVLMVGRLSPQKNHKSLIKAMAYIKEKYQYACNLVIVGEGELYDELRTFAVENNVADICFFEGNQSEPQNYYAAAHLFAFSSFSEGLPTVLIEAASFGLPLVSSDSSVREILGCNEYGLISPIDDYITLGENIYVMLSDKNLYHKYSALALARSEVFAPEGIMGRIEGFLQTLH